MKLGDRVWMDEWLQSNVIEQDEGFMEDLSENIVRFELWHAVIESSWVDLEKLKGCEVPWISMIHNRL